MAADTRTSVAIAARAAVKEAGKPVEQAKSGARIQAAKHRVTHPFTGVAFPVTHPVDVLEIDGWLKSQLDAGILIKV
jgi:hypothetical protein